MDPLQTDLLIRSKCCLVLTVDLVLNFHNEYIVAVGVRYFYNVAYLQV